MRRNAFKKRKARDASAPSRHSLPMRAKFLMERATRDFTMQELQTYAQHKHMERKDGLPIVQFERRPEAQIIDMTKASAKGGASVGPQPPLNSIKRMSKQIGQGADAAASGFDSPKNLHDKMRPLSQPSSQQREQIGGSMTSGLFKHASLASAQPDMMPSRAKQNYYTQPDDKHVVYQVQTGSCYDDIIERNFNTGLPKGISFITTKQLEGKKKKDNRVEEQDLPYEEREFNMKFRETWAIQRKIA